MKNEEAMKFIDGRLIELVCQSELQLSKQQRARIDDETAFLMYARGLCERAKPEKVRVIEPVSVKAFDGETDKVYTYRCYPCPHCGKWITDNEGHHNCEWCGQALDFSEVQDGV